MAPMTWVDWLILAGMVCAVAAAIWFISAYSRRTWENSPYGRNLMAGSLSVGVIGMFGALYATTHVRAAGVLEAVAWVYASAVLCHRRKLLAAAHKKRATTSVDGNVG